MKEELRTKNENHPNPKSEKYSVFSPEKSGNLRATNFLNHGEHKEDAKDAEK